MLEQVEEERFGEDMEKHETEDKRIIKDAGIDLEDDEESLGNVGMRQKATG